jgi:hypothetical protein
MAVSYDKMTRHDYYTSAHLAGGMNQEEVKAIVLAPAHPPEGAVMQVRPDCWT